MKKFIEATKEAIKFFDDNCHLNYRLFLVISGIICCINMINLLLLKIDELKGFGIFGIIAGAIGYGAMIETFLRYRSSK